MLVHERTTPPPCMRTHHTHPHFVQLAAAALKREMAADWLPEFRPVSIVPPARSPDTVLERVTRISSATILQVS